MHAYTPCSVRPHDPTFEILAHRYVTRLRGLLTSLDPELIRILSIISIAGLLTNLLTSRTARAYVARSLRHTGSLALLSCSLLLPALSLLQARVGAAGPLGTLGGTPANVMATLFPSVVTAVRVNPSIRRTLIALPPVTLLALLIALMRMRVGRR